MTSHEADILMLRLGLGGLAMFAGVLVIVSVNRQTARHHPRGALGLVCDNLVFMLPALLMMGVVVLRGATGIEHAAIWPLPLVALALMAVFWMRVPAVRRAAGRLSAAQRKPSR